MSSTVDQVLKYTKYPNYIPSTSTGQVLIFLKSIKVHQVLSYQVQVLMNIKIFHWSLTSISLYNYVCSVDKIKGIFPKLFLYSKVRIDQHTEQSKF